jgi:hypothetical protein
VGAWRWIVGALVTAGIVVGVVALAGGGSGDDAVGPDVKAATVKPIAGSDLSRVELSADAARRLGITTAPVVADGKGEVMPYDAVLYDASGATFTYTSPQPRVFVRAPVVVRRIVGARALLSSGPPAGTAVVTRGAPELYGTEFEVEED